MATNPLTRLRSLTAAGIPSSPGPTVALIQALGNNSWLDLGRPAPDPTYGWRRGASFSAAQCAVPALRGAYVMGAGPHAGFLPKSGSGGLDDGFGLDDFWFYDINQHRWICIYPGADTTTFSADVANGDLHVVTPGTYQFQSDTRPIPNFGGHNWLLGSTDGTRLFHYDPFICVDFGSDISALTPGYVALKNQGANAGNRPTVHRYSPDGTLAWTPRSTATTPSTDQEGVNITTYYNGNYYTLGRNGVFKFVESGPNWVDMAPINATGVGAPLNCSDCLGVLDTKRNKFYGHGGNLQFTNGFTDAECIFTYDFATNTWTRPMPTGGVTGWASFNDNSGFMHYDSVNDKVIFFRAFGRQINVWDPATNVVTTLPITIPSTLNDAIVNASYDGNQGWYDPVLNAHFLFFAHDSYTASGYASSTMYVYRYQQAAPVATAPILACTDILSGPRTGNSDTAFGQVANQNGAYVTIYGYNFGNPEDTVTCTINGAAALIVDRGQATGARSPATLYNAYQKLQVIVAQVPAAATVGAGVIDVVVNGQASLSTDLPFTVTSTGTIRFVSSPGFAVTSVLDSMVGGDILYLKNGADVLGGWAMQTNTDGRNAQMAVGAYPGASVQFGDSSHDSIFQAASGSGRNLTVFKLRCVGNSVAPFQPVTLGFNGRFVGCTLTCPGGQGKAGAIASAAPSDNWRVLANEFFNCGVTPSDPDYHVIYRGGARGVTDIANVRVEVGCEIAYNYFHDNGAARAINCFNRNIGSAGNWDNPISDHHIHHNVIVNQQWAGIGQQYGVVGYNRIHDNLLINCGLNTGGGSSNHNVAVECHPSYTQDWPFATSPITVEFYNNTIINGGDVTASTSANGAWELVATGGYTLILKNNITYQKNGLQYISTNSDIAAALDPTNRSNNLWFGAGAAPVWDSVALNRDPLVVSDVSPFDLHLRSTSPCLLAGTSLTNATFDLDGLSRPINSPCDLGAYQFSTATVIPPPPGPPAPTVEIDLTFQPGLHASIRRAQVPA